MGLDLTTAWPVLEGPIVLAVSGGVDSMVLLHLAVGSQGNGAPITVATFDHRSGPHASDAVRLVTEEASRLGVEVVAGRAATTADSEAAWRSQRWAFLRDVATSRQAGIATGHTRDDQIETVAMRILRSAGARGLAGLLAPSAVQRPLLRLTRREVRRHADALAIRWLEDPTNRSSRFLRNRVRHDLLPALRTVRPEIDQDLWDLGERAADLRREVEQVAGRWIRGDTRGALMIGVDLLHDLDEASRAVIWPELLARRRIVMDTRGIRRLARVAPGARDGTRIPLSGGLEIVRKGEFLVLKATAAGPVGTAVLEDELRFGRFRFRRSAAPDERRSPWGAWLSSQPAEVRSWRAGDRIAAGGQGAQRRVKRFFAEAGVHASDREGWPVVVQDGEITWVPGVCRVFAATERTGGAARYFSCEFDNR
jgi:tRNA(Ile)-lysidine synthase